MPYSLYCHDARRYFLFYLLHEATPIGIVIDGHFKRFSGVATWKTRKSLTASVGETVTVPSLCLDPIKMNSV